MRAHRPLLLALAALLGACSADTVPPPPKAPIGPLQPVAMTSASPDIVTANERALPELYAKALSSAHPGAPFSGLTPLLNQELAQFSSPGMAPAHEPAGVVAAHDALFGAFDDRTFTLSRVWRTPNEESIEWVMTGKHARDWMGIAATQRPVAFKGLTLLWTKDDGTIVDIHVYFDVGLLRAQLSGSGPKELLDLPAPAVPSGPAQVFDQTVTGSANEARNVDVVKGWLDALENNNEANYVGALTDDAEITTLESATPRKGKEGARKYYKATHAAIGQLDTTVDNAWGVGSFAVVEYDIDGEQLGTFSWIPLLAPLPARTTQLAHFDIVDVCEIQDGKIARVWRYDNPVEVLGGAWPLVKTEGPARP